jgi:predicted  nucleic acid-binding Zn-ribbon protein
MADLQAFEVVMKRLLDDGLRPVKADIASLTSKIDTFQQSLIDVQNSVEHANNVAGDAKNIATGLEKRVAQLESDLMISQNTHKQLLEQTLRIET